MNDTAGYKCLTKEDLLTISKSKVPIPENEALRIFTLKQTELLDSDSSDPSFDRFATLAQRLFNVPIALVSLVDIDRQWFKANVGLEGCSETHRNLAFCAYTVLPNSPDVFVIEDALLDYRFRNSPLVLGEPHIRFYAGAALIIDDVKIGSLCIIDRVPHLGFSETDRMNMLDLGAAVSNLVRERRDALVRTNQECAKMMSDMMRKVRMPLSTIAMNANTLMVNVTKGRLKYDRSTDLLLDSANSLESTSTPVTDDEDMDEETSHVMSNLSTAVAQLNIIMESSICLGEFVLEKAESDKKEWASFTTANILETVTNVRKTLKNMDMSTNVLWDVDSSQLSLGYRHVYSPKAVSFALLNSVEQLSLHWKTVEVSVSFKDTINEEYDSIIQQLDDAPICDIESTWNQGLLEINFMLKDKRDKCESEGINGTESSQGYFSFYSLQQVLKDVEGGCTVLDTGSSYAQTMKIWMPCAIIMCDRRSSKNIRSDTNSLSVSPSSVPGDSFPVMEETKLVGIEGSDLNLLDDNHPEKILPKKSDKVFDLSNLVDMSSADNKIEINRFVGGDLKINYRDDKVKPEQLKKSSSLPLPGEVQNNISPGSLSPVINASSQLVKNENSPTKFIPIPETTTIKKLNVLLVEDTLTQQKLMGKWLNGQGCVVTFALNGKIGLELMKSKKFDICLMDFLLPVMTGADAIQKLNNWCIDKSSTTPPDDPNAPLDLDWYINKEMMIVGLSANARDDELVKAFENGMHFFCPKPVETSMLASILKMKRDAPNLKSALKEIGKQAVRLESQKISIISSSGSSSNIHRNSKITLKGKDSSGNSQRFPEEALEEESKQTCTGASHDVIVRKGKTGWRLFNKISRLLTGGKINPGDERCSSDGKDQSDTHSDENCLNQLHIK